MTADRGAAILEGSPYQAYLYAYPHKLAYRAFAPKIPLEAAWAKEPKGSLFLYLHVPFCEMRCGFCNLFTSSRSDDDQTSRWLAALERQAADVRRALPEARFARCALGGGTPTMLAAARLERVFSMLERTFDLAVKTIPTSVEVSPDTLDREKLGLLRGLGVDRISLGVQSFFDDEARAAGRPQRRETVEAALDAIRSHGFPVLNVDLIYGIEGQTEASFVESLRIATKYAPQELYLYPLYVRPLTGLGRSARRWDDQRLALYRAGRAFLLAEGFTQSSMRMFRRGDLATHGPVYCVQDDGMLGLGVGARSYTRELHYASEYAVSARAVSSLIDAYCRRESFSHVEHGIVLDDDEQRRRWVLLGLLGDGLDRVAYRERFGADVLQHLPELRALFPRSLATEDEARIALTEAGVERSDAIGPFLVSSAVHERMTSAEVR